MFLYPPDEPVMSMAFSLLAFIITTITLLFVGWYIKEIRRSPNLS